LGLTCEYTQERHYSCPDCGEEWNAP
jgi:hypothetical protein